MCTDDQKTTDKQAQEREAFLRRVEERRRQIARIGTAASGEARSYRESGAIIVGWVTPSDDEED